MKRLILFAALIPVLAAETSRAQALPNNGFESWSVSQNQDTVPDHWWGIYYGTVTKTTDSYAGNYAARIAGVPMCGIAPGVLNNGAMPFNAYCNPSGGGSAMQLKYSAFTGYYKNGGICASDSSVITVIFKKYNAISHKTDTVQYGQLVLPPVSSYTQFVVNISDRMPGIAPDSVLIRMEASKYNCFSNDSNWNWILPALYVDEVSFIREIPLGIESMEIPAAKLYPNPFSNHATLEFVHTIDQGRVDVFDSFGKLVKTMEVSNSKAVILDRNGIASGTYLYRVSGNNRLIEQGRFIIN